MGYRFSNQAVIDGNAIYRASLNMFGQRAADRYFTQMLNSAQFAADNPLFAPERTETSIAVRVRYFGSHLLVYQILDDDIVIRRIFHQSQDWADLL